MSEVKEKDVEAFFVLQELAHIFSVPAALKAALELRIPDILAAAPEAGVGLTPEEIADKLPRKSLDAAQKVARILRLLARYKGVFAETTGASGSVRYGLTDVSKYFVTGSEFDLTPYTGLTLRRDMMAPLNHLREIVEEDANACMLANGADLWAYGSANPGFNDSFNAAMRSRSKLLNTIIAQNYDGFKDVKCLVDVGGGVGGALAQIVAAHPHIQGRNFDLPHVICTAPNIPGVEHIPGNFLEFVPSGDAVILEQVLHDWEDEDSITILKNCRKALPGNGRLLIREHVIDPARNSPAKTAAALNSDMYMMAVCRGLERTTADWTRLLAAAGFPPPAFLRLQGLDLIEAVLKA